MSDDLILTVTTMTDRIEALLKELDERRAEIVELAELLEKLCAANARLKALNDERQLEIDALTRMNGRK